MWPTKSERPEGRKNPGPAGDTAIVNSWNAPGNSAGDGPHKKAGNTSVSGFLNALWIIPILGVLILLHELGHFVMARRAGVKVEEFGIGLPPRIWGKQRGETLYSINALPIGGFVRVLGEDGKSFSKDSMQAKTAWQRAKFLGAGSAMNFLTAFLLIGVLVATDKEPPDNLTQNVYIAEVVAQSPAEAAGWQAGDQIVEAGGTAVTSNSVLENAIVDNAGEELLVVIERNGEKFQSTVVPRVDPPPGEGRTGIRMQGAWAAPVVVEDVPEGSYAAQAGLHEGDIITQLGDQSIEDPLGYAHYLSAHAGETVTVTAQRGSESITGETVVPRVMPTEGDPLGATLAQDIDYQRVPILEIPGETVSRTVDTIRGMGRGLADLVSGRTPLDEVAGPIGMGQLTSEVISESPEPLWVTLVGIATLLSLNLGLLNLLPLPALDGGRLLFVVLEVLRRGKRVPPEKEGIVHLVGLAILLTLMFAIAFQDVDRLISGGSFLK
jgi:regulator of sigma E protease